MSQSFGPSVRLRASAEFAVVQKTGRRVPGRFVTVLVKANTLDCDRLGVIASRKLGNAVVRNAAKRRRFRKMGPILLSHDEQVVHPGGEQIGFFG